MMQVIKEGIMHTVSGTQAKGDFFNASPTYLMLKGYLVYWINTNTTLKSKT